MKQQHDQQHPEKEKPPNEQAVADPKEDEAAMEHGNMDHEGDGGMDHSGHEEMFRQRFWVSLVLTIPVLIFSPTIQDWLSYSIDFPLSQWITPLFGLIIFVYGGLPFLQMAQHELKQREPGMMALISLAITVAFVYSVSTLFIDLGGGSFWWELVTLIDVMLLGHWIEMRSVRQASGSLDELAKLMPDEAERITEDGTEKVAASALQEGDLVLVRPGASIPADGEIAEGSSRLDESMITGESKPVKKGDGDAVIAGTVNGDGSLRVRVTATGDETALSGIMRLVNDAQNSKSSTQLLADRAAKMLFYIALGTAALTAIAWVIAVGFDVEVIRRVVAVLVIACPHALGLAVPLVVAISTSKAANNGILVRDRRALEAARELNAVIFDKTGTLTKGEQGIVGMRMVDGVGEDEALALAAAIEGDSEHMVARAIRNAAQERDLTPPRVSNFEAIKGRGVRADYEGSQAYVGGPRLLEKLDLTLPNGLQQFTEQAGREGHSVVYLVQNGEAVAGFESADVIRPESHQAVKALHDMEIEVAMLTGDSQEVADSVASELGIDTVFAQVLPEDKDKKVQELREQNKKVAMVGDGVNDAPALKRADVGIAIGSGTDVAVESAGIILVQSNPLDVVKAIRLSQVNHRKLVQNIWWAAGYNIIAIPLAAGVLAPVGFVMPVAVGALIMSLSTVIVAINANLLRRVDLSEA